MTVRFRLPFFAICSVLAGCTFWLSKPNDPDTLTYVDWVASNLAATADTSFYQAQATPELLRSFPAAKFDQASAKVKGDLGSFVAYHDAQGFTRVYNHPVNGVTEIGQYQATADYKLSVEKLNGDWKLAGYWVNIRL